MLLAEENNARDITQKTDMLEQRIDDINAKITNIMITQARIIVQQQHLADIIENQTNSNNTKHEHIIDAIVRNKQLDSH